MARILHCWGIRLEGPGPQGLQQAADPGQGCSRPRGSRRGPTGRWLGARLSHVCRHILESEPAPHSLLPGPWRAQPAQGLRVLGLLPRLQRMLLDLRPRAAPPHALPMRRSCRGRRVRAPSTPSRCALTRSKHAALPGSGLQQGDPFASLRDRRSRRLARCIRWSWPSGPPSSSDLRNHSCESASIEPGSVARRGLALPCPPLSALGGPRKELCP